MIRVSSPPLLSAKRYVIIAPLGFVFAAGFTTILCLSEQRPLTILR